MIFLIYKILAILPLKIRILFGRSLGFIYGLIPGRENKIVKLQMKLCLKENYSRDLAYKVFSSTGQTILECLNMQPFLRNINKFVECEDWQIAEDLNHTGNSIIVLSSHTGNWDLLAAYAIQKGFNVSTIARKARNPHLHKLLVKIRGSYGINTIWKDSPSATREIIQALRTRTVLAALIDQDLEGDGMHVPFFNIPAKYPSSLINLAKKNNSHIIAAFIFRKTRSKYKIFLHKLDATAETSEIINQYSNLLENYIRLHPEQWVWFHKRWRSLPDGRRLSSKEYIEYLTNYEDNLLKNNP